MRQIEARFQALCYEREIAIKQYEASLAQFELCALQANVAGMDAQRARMHTMVDKLLDIDAGLALIKRQALGL